MLVTFKTKAHANIPQFEQVALRLLKMMGHSSTVPGAIKAEDVAKALQLLKFAIDSEPEVEPSTDFDDYDEDEEPEVSIRHRALPLIDLLQTAVDENDYVMWDWQ